MEGLAYEWIVGRLFQKRDHAHRLPGVVRVGRPEQRVGSDTQNSREKIAQRVPMPRADQLIAKHFIDGRGRGVRPYSPVPCPQLIQGAQLEPSRGHEMFSKQRSNPPRWQADLVVLQGSKVDCRVALFAFENLADALVAGRVDVLTGEEMRAVL